jgi:hypothetical protein
MNAWKLSPSDLTFLWDGCRRCFYLKVVRKVRRPPMPMPSIFIQIDQLMKDFFEGKPTAEISADLPRGNVRFGDKWVTSLPTQLPHRAVQAYFRGRFDTVVAFDDGSYGVVDFKTSRPKPEHIPFYSRQLHAYAYALEHAAPDRFALIPVSRLGLLCVEPTALERSDDGRLAYLGEATWLECPKDYDKFLGFIDVILAVLEQPNPPPPAPRCRWCQYRGLDRR